MSAVLMSSCAGLWRRTLLIEADGSRIAGGDVRWLQGDSVYIDSRGFGGTLGQRGDVFEWQRMVDLEPPGPFPDEGAMHWDGGTLVETGVHADYVEHWVRDDGPRIAALGADVAVGRRGRRPADAGRYGVRLAVFDGGHDRCRRGRRMGCVGPQAFRW